jgi:hypothetical protein
VLTVGQFSARAAAFPGVVGASIGRVTKSYVRRRRVESVLTNGITGVRRGECAMCELLARVGPARR